MVLRWSGPVNAPYHLKILHLTSGLLLGWVRPCQTRLRLRTATEAKGVDGAVNGVDMFMPEIAL